MFLRKLCIVGAAVAGLSACSAPQGPVASGEARTAPEAGYMAPPAITQAVLSGDAVVLTGSAVAQSQVRLATPAGQALTTEADRRGSWTLSVPRTVEAQIFGLSMLIEDRRVQAQGYVLVTPKGQVALLRAGAGALRLDALPAGAIGAFDFDGDGGAVVSGVAPAEATLSVRLDGRQSTEGRSDPAGRYSIQLPRIVEGVHRIDVVGDTFGDAAEIAVSVAQPLAGTPARSQLSGGGLRTDWQTPGGGVQSTVIID